MLSILFLFQSITIYTKNKEFISSLEPLVKYIEEEINTPRVIFDHNIDRFVQYTSTPNNVDLGKRLKGRFSKDLIEKLKNITQSEILEYREKKTLKIGEVDILEGELIIQEKYTSEGKNRSKLLKYNILFFIN